MKINQVLLKLGTVVARLVPFGEASHGRRWSSHEWCQVHLWVTVHHTVTPPVPFAPPWSTIREGDPVNLVCYGLRCTRLGCQLLMLGLWIARHKMREERCYSTLTQRAGRALRKCLGPQSAPLISKYFFNLTCTHRHSPWSRAVTLEWRYRVRQNENLASFEMKHNVPQGRCCLDDSSSRSWLACLLDTPPTFLS